MTDYLLIDISNSYAKFAFASRRWVSAPARISTGELTSAVVAGFFRKRKVRKVVVSSVVPEKNSAISKAAKKRAKVLWLDWKLNLSVGIDYPKPQSIGADRLANAAAAAELYGFPAVVVDFGTAVTFDIVSERRTYVGGVIAPGLRQSGRCYLARYSDIVDWFGKSLHESKQNSSRARRFMS